MTLFAFSLNLPTLWLTERVKPRDCVLCVPLNIADKNRAPKNRNARSGVRFLGKRSNKRIYAMRQILCAACTSSPCCDARSGFPSNHGKPQASARRGFREYLISHIFSDPCCGSSFQGARRRTFCRWSLPPSGNPLRR